MASPKKKSKTKKSLNLFSKKTIVLFGIIAFVAILAWKLTPTSKATNSFAYSALGDSISSPLNFGTNNYVPVYSSYVAKDLAVNTNINYYNYPGGDSAVLLNAIKTNETWRTGLSQSNVISLFIGFNDLYGSRLSFKANTCGGTDNQDCLRAAYTNFQVSYDQILTEIKTLNTNPNTILRAVTIYNPFVAPDTADGSFSVYKSYVDQYNSYIWDKAFSKGFLVADIYYEFNGRLGTDDPIAKNLINTDGIHPNQRGMTVIANTLRSIKYFPVDGSPAITCIGDVNLDKKVNSTDQLIEAQHFNAKKGTPQYLANADVNNDWIINSIDSLISAKHTGTCLH